MKWLTVKPTRFYQPNAREIALSARFASFDPKFTSRLKIDLPRHLSKSGLTQNGSLTLALKAASH